jgi:hypothetical protein
MNITLKGLKQFNGMDGVAFTAKLCFDGKVVGTVMNDGNGGSNSYHGVKSHLLQKPDYDALIKAANDAGHTGTECEDIFIEDIMCDMDAEKAHKKFQKKGFKFTAYFVGVDMWQDNVLIGFNDKKAIAKELKDKKLKLRKIFGEEVAHA